MAIQLFQIQELKLTNYKNYAFFPFVFDTKLNFIIGKNGVGKTSLLDAIYYVSFSKSYLSSSDLWVIQYDKDFFRIEARINIGADNQLIEVKYQKQIKKEYFINKAKLEKQAHLIGKFPAVIITPDDNQLILGASELRRKFIDATLSQFSSEYLDNLLLYNKVLLQRNALLKSFYENRNFNKELLSIYNQQLIVSGTKVFHYRKDFIAKFIPIFSKIYSEIFDGNELVNIKYESDLLEMDFEHLLQYAENNDRQAQRTTKGIHTDDFAFELNGYPIKKTGSQGQQKTFLLALKMAQFELLKKESNIMPILLLDDIFDKLDVQRIAQILQLINSEETGQVFITDTDLQRINLFIQQNNINNYKIITIE